MAPVYPYKTGQKGKKTTYFFKTCIKGRQYIRRGFQSKSEAKYAEELFRVQTIQSIPDRRRKVIQRTPTWEILLTSYLSWIKGQVKITYFYSLKRTLEREFLPMLPNIEVEKMTYSHFEKARHKLQSDPNCTNTKNKRLRLLKRIFEYCKIYFNYECLDVLKLQPFKDYSIKKKEIKTKIITHDIFKQIYDSANEFYKLLYLTLYLYGLRFGEAMGLKVESFDFENNIMYIYRSIAYKTGKGSIAVSPKTSSSNRALWMIDAYVDLLKAHIKKYKLKNEDYIFFSTTSRRKPLSEHAVRYNITKIGKAIGFSFHPHMFRHTNVSELREKGISLEEIQKYEGHSSIEITEKVYLHETEERKKRTQSILEDIAKSII